MKVQEFIDKVGKSNSTQAIKSMEKILSVKNYLPIAEKKVLANKIVDRSVVVEEGYVKIDDINRYVIFTLEVIQAYTDLEFSDDIDIAMTEYDALSQSGKLNNIIALFEAEYKTVLEFTNMATEYMLRNNSIEASFVKLLNSLSDATKSLTSAISSKVEEFNLESLGISQEDLSMLGDFIGNYIK